MKEKNNETIDRSDGDNSTIRGIKKTIDKNDNGKETDAKDLSIKKIHSSIHSLSEMGNANQAINLLNNQKSNKNSENFDNIHLATTLFSFKNEMTKGFNDLKEEMKNGLKGIADSINNLAKSLNIQSSNSNRNSNQNSSMNSNNNSRYIKFIYNEFLILVVSIAVYHAFCHLSKK